LLDTYIGDRDGVPFLIPVPGKNELCKTQKKFPEDAPLPDFIQALETEDPANPGTVAHVQFRVGGGLEPPGRVTLGAYPDGGLSRFDWHCRQEKTMWEVPVFPIKKLKPEGDSAVVLYWEPKELPPGKSREVGFAYGVGSVSGKEGKGKLALTVGGSFRA